MEPFLFPPLGSQTYVFYILWLLIWSVEYIPEDDPIFAEYNYNVQADTLLESSGNYSSALSGYHFLGGRLCNRTGRTFDHSWIVKIQSPATLVLSLKIL